VRYLDLQEGRRRAHRVAEGMDARSQWTVAVLGYCVSGSAYERKLVRTRKPCSCFICGNPRRYRKAVPERLTIQERRRLAQMQSDIETFGGGE